MKRIFTFVYTLFILTFAATSTLLAGNVITYTASEKLPETTEERTEGLHTNSFNVAITSHEFSDGTGTITFAGEVTTIGNRAFYGCSGLTSVEIPSSVTSIGDHAFAYSGLTSITIPESVTAIGEGAFVTCSKMTSITIPNSVKTIGNSALQGCSGLTSIEIPSSITTISNGIFRSCTGLKSVTIPNTITTIGENAFWNCNGLTSIKIPNSVKTIGEYAFRSCTSLTSINIPDAVTTIEEGTFYNCSSLPSITIPNTVTTIGRDAFCDCSKLASITIPRSVTSIGDYIFRFCSGLTSIEIPNSVETIGREAFLNCTSLASITIPSSVTTIGGEALKGCTGLTSITCEATTPPSCGDDCFYWVNKSIPVYVPFGSVDAYKAADKWQEFTNIKADSKDTFLDRITLSINKDTLYQNKEFKYNGTVTANYVNGGTNDVTESATFTGYNMATLGNQVVTVSYTEGEITKTAQYTLTVKAIPAAKYVPVAWNKIESGSKYFITAENEEEYYFAAKAFAVGKAPAIVFEASFAPETDMWVFTKNEDDTWKISTTDGADLYITNTNNGLASAANQGSDFTVAQGTSAEFTDLTASDGVNTRYIALYNKNDFRCYRTSGTSGIRNMKLYGLKKESPLAAPVITPSVVAETYWDPVKVGLSCATEGATIYYSIDGSDPSIKYTDSITISATTTVKAIAKKQGLDNSNIVSKTFTFGDIYANLAELVNAGEPTLTGKTVKVTLNNEEILSLVSNNGIMLQATKEKQIEVYCYNRPTDWEVGGKVSGTLICPWHKYNDTWELSPASWDNLTYTPAVTKSIITYTATSKLPEVTDEFFEGLHTNAFNVAITSHKFSNGTGTITFAGEVTTIGNRAFYICELTSIEIPSSVTSIGDHAFAYSGLTSITIPSSVKTIGEGAFDECCGLTSVEIPSSVTKIGTLAFCNVNNIVYNGTATGSPWGAKCVNGYVDGYLVYSDASKTKLCGCSTAAKGEIVLPNSVTTIGDWAFSTCKGLTSVEIPSSVTKIGTLAFCNCTGLMSVTIPNSVTTIGESAFRFCTSLTSFNVNPANTHYCSIDGVLFNYAKDMLIQYPIGNTQTEYTIPNSVTSIEGYAFASCSNLTSITIPNSVKTIGGMAFYNSGLTSVIVCWTNVNELPIMGSDVFLSIANMSPAAATLHVPAGTKSIYKNADQWKDFGTITEEQHPLESSVITYTATRKLPEITDPNSAGLHTNAFNVAITSHDFFNGTGTITFAGNVTTIGDYAFHECSDLTSITIPNSVTTIGEYAFRSCTGLTSITIPNSVTTIGDKAFLFCTNLTSINVHTANTHYCSIGGVLFNYVKDMLIQYPIGNTQTEYTIPNSVTSIGGHAFASCSNLTSITIPNSVKTIGDYAFLGCSDLTSITIPNSVTSIEYMAFSDCSGLTSITCEAVTPPSCGWSCFNGVDKSIPVYVPEGSISAYKAADRWKEFINIHGIVNPNTIITYTATEKLTETETTDELSEGLHTNAFNVAIASHTFSNGTGTITFAGEVTTIGEFAFNFCTGLTSITIPNSVTSIKYRAFYVCPSLTSVTIPNSVTSIGEDAFTQVNNIVYNGTATGLPWGAKCVNGYVDGYLVYSNASKTRLCGCFATATGEITIPNSVTTIGDNAFARCTGLTSISIPNSVTTIGEMAFLYCGLTSPLYNATIFAYLPISYQGAYTIPDGIKHIAGGACCCCFDLTSITIPSSVISIEYMAFCDCSGLTSITCEAVTSPFYGEYCFLSVDKSIPVYVPRGSVDAYKAANGWKEFTNIQPIGGEDPRNKIITYTATEKLTETTDETISGFHTNAFNVAITSHDFFNGTGTITFAGNVTTIGDYAFFECSDLTSITIPNSVTTIGDYAFRFCTGLTSISIPNSVTTIGEGAFTQVNNIVYNGTATGSPWGAKCVNGYVDGYLVYSDASKTKLCGCSTAATGEITIPNSITSIGDYAFLFCTDLTSITCEAVTPPSCGVECFRDVDKSIPVYVLEGSISAYKTANEWKDFTNIQAIVIPNTIITYTATSKLDNLTADKFGDIGIQSHNFSNGTGTITFAGEVTEIGERAFNFYSTLTSINLPNSVTTIGSRSFDKCTALQSVTMGNSITTIKDYAFFACDKLTSINLSESITTLESGVFKECKSLPSVNIPHLVTEIGWETFHSCYALKTITIPAAVQTIGDDVFKDCTGLTSITSLATTPPSCGWSCFDGVDKSIPVTVPKESISAYKAANGWKEFTNYVGDNRVYITDAKLSFGPEYIATHRVIYYSIVATDYVVFLWANATNPYGNFIDVFDFANSGIRIFQNGIMQKELRFNKADEFEVHQDGNTMYLTANVTDTEGTQYIISASGYSGTLAYDATSPYMASFDYEDISDISMKDGTCSIIVQSEKQYLELEVYTNPSNSKLPAGTYTISDSKTPGTVLKSIGFTGSEVSRSYAATITADGQYIETMWYLVEGTVTIDYNVNDQLMIMVNAYNTSHQSVNVAVNVSNTYQINTSAKHGYVEGAGFYEMGSVALLIAYPDKGYKFVRWSDETIYNPYYFVVDGNKNIEAIFERVTDDLQDIYQPSPVNKIMKDGVIYIQINGNLYDVFGRPIL